VITRNVFARGAASVILAGAIVLGTSGCSFFSTQATLIPYDPSDGISATLGTIAVRNTLGIVSDDGLAISLMTTLINTGSTAHSVNLQWENANGEKVTVSKVVKAGTTAFFGNTPEDDQIVILMSGVPAGALLPVYVQWGKEPGKQMLVPVFEATGIYSELAPPAVAR